MKSSQHTFFRGHSVSCPSGICRHTFQTSKMRSLAAATVYISLEDSISSEASFIIQLHGAARAHWKARALPLVTGLTLKFKHTSSEASASPVPSLPCQHFTICRQFAPTVRSRRVLKRLHGRSGLMESVRWFERATRRGPESHGGRGRLILAKGGIALGGVSGIIFHVDMNAGLPHGRKKTKTELTGRGLDCQWYDQHGIPVQQPGSDKTPLLGLRWTVKSGSWRYPGFEGRDKAMGAHAEVFLQMTDAREREVNLTSQCKFEDGVSHAPSEGSSVPNSDESGQGEGSKSGHRKRKSDSGSWGGNEKNPGEGGDGSGGGSGAGDDEDGSDPDRNDGRGGGAGKRRVGRPTSKVCWDCKTANHRKGEDFCRQTLRHVAPPWDEDPRSGRSKMAHAIGPSAERESLGVAKRCEPQMTISSPSASACPSSTPKDALSILLEAATNMPPIPVVPSLRGGDPVGAHQASIVQRGTRIRYWWSSSQHLSGVVQKRYDSKSSAAGWWNVLWDADQTTSQVLLSAEAADSRRWEIMSPMDRSDKFSGPNTPDTK